MTKEEVLCKHDSGSMYGNVPLCDRPAVWRVDYHNGTYKLTTYACDQHLGITQARVYPGHDQTTELTLGDTGEGGKDDR